MHTLIEVAGARRSIHLSALIDTGFDGYLCLPIGIAVSLGLELVAQGTVEYADGRTELELEFSGQVTLLAETRTVRITLTRSDEALVGTDLLRGCTLFIDFDTGEYRLQRKAIS